MSVQVGTNIDPRTAADWIAVLGWHLRPDEELLAMFKPHRHVSHDVVAVTTERVLMASITGRGNVRDEFAVQDVVRAYTAFDRTEPIVHVPLRDGGHYLLRVAHIADDSDARALAATIAEAAAGTDSTLMPGYQGRAGGAELLLAAGSDFLQLVVGRDEVERRDTAPILNSLAALLANPPIARIFKSSVVIGFDGFNQDPRELWQIPEVRSYVADLDARFPYWLYFLYPGPGGFAVIWRCVARHGDGEPDPEDLRERLTRWWFPAMNAMCQFAGLDQNDVFELSSGLQKHLRGS